jgi:uncharacterized membrane protein YhaH (DUF805 family)
MLGFVFGFNARLGRMHFFFATIALAVLMTGVCFVIAMYMAPHLPAGTRLTAAALATWPPVIVAIVAFGWASFTLHCMRFRDIGWDPVCVIPAWIALLIVDRLVATKIPAWSFGHEHHGTIVGALISLGLFLALMFWPGGDYQGPTETPRTPDLPSSRPRANSAAEARIARATGAQFGRRAFEIPVSVTSVRSHLLVWHADRAALLEPFRHR